MRLSLSGLRFSALWAAPIARRRSETGSQRRRDRHHCGCAGLCRGCAADLSADDAKDKDKAKTYADAKKAADDYAAAVKLEPLAVKLADNVGHNRVAINFMWTLVTGFLVMFMQAGSRSSRQAVPGEKRQPHDVDELHDLPDGHARVLPVRLRLHVRRHRRPRIDGRLCRPEHELGVTIGGHFFGLLGWKGFLLQGAGYDTAAFTLFLFQMVFMDTTATVRPAAWPSAGDSPPS